MVWWRRWIRDIMREFEEMDKMFERIFRELEEGKFEAREPIIFGYSIRVEPGKEPEIRTFGNVKPSIAEISGYREPFVDIIKNEKEGTLSVLIELPGVKKEDIKLRATETELEVKAESDNRKYYKRIDLGTKVDPHSAKARFNNGVLEVEFKLKESKKGFDIKID